MVTSLTKSDLKTGDVVITAGGWKGIILRDTSLGSIIRWVQNESGERINKYRSLFRLNENLTYDTNKKIVKVYRASIEQNLLEEDTSKLQLLWEDKAREMTVADIERALGYRIKIVK